MKKILLIGLVFVLVVLPGHADVFLNGGFETGSPPSDWYPDNAALASSGTAHAGSACLRITASAENGNAYQPTSLSLNKLYRVSGWYKTAGTDTGKVAAYETGGWSQVMEHTLSAQANWTYFEHYFFSNAATAAHNFYFYALPAGGAVVFFDDASLVRKPLLIEDDDDMRRNPKAP